MGSTAPRAPSTSSADRHTPSVKIARMGNPFRPRRRTTGMDSERSAATPPNAVPSTPDPDALLVQVGRGDRAAFEALYATIAPMVLGVITRVVRDPAQSEEVAQEALVDVWRTATRFDPDRGSARAFVAVIAHRRAVDRVRSEEAARRRDTQDAVLDLHRPDAVDAGEEVIESFERRQVRNALDDLTDMQREAIVLAYYDGRTQSEVASLLGVPLGTVKTRIRDGLIRLRDTMGVSA